MKPCCIGQASSSSPWQVFKVTCSLSLLFLRLLGERQATSGMKDLEMPGAASKFGTWGLGPSMLSRIKCLACGLSQATWNAQSQSFLFVPLAFGQGQHTHLCQASLHMRRGYWLLILDSRNQRMQAEARTTRAQGNWVNKFPSLHSKHLKAQPTSLFFFASEP